MKRSWLTGSIVLGFVLACSGGMSDEPASDGDDGEERDDKVVVVPVPDGEDGEGEHWCCEYESDDGTKRFALVEGPSECNEAYAEMNGRWVSGSQCTPCCCETANDPDDPDRGTTHERTTPSACAPVGECVSPGDIEECQGEDDGEDAEDDEDEDKAEPVPNRQPPIPPRPTPRGGDRDKKIKRIPR